MRNFLLIGLGVALLAACGTSSPPASISTIAQMPDASSGSRVIENSKRWFVELGSSTTDGVSLQSVQANQEVFRQAAEASGVKVLRSYSRLFNGFAVEIAGGNASKLYALPGVTAIYPVYTYSLPKPEPANPDLASAITQTGADIAQNDLGLTGKGIRVGVIDSGIDLQHPAFAGRVNWGYDFVGDAYDAADPAHSTPVPDNNPDDCGGHGTHVAGIIGGKDAQITGVAPKVRFGAYKVFGCEGSVDDTVVMAALERAEEDGMNIVNMSLGSAFGWSATGKAIQKLIREGVVVVASAGNDGTLGLFATGGPAATSKVISVASFDNIRVNAKGAIANPGNLPIGYLTIEGAAEPPTSGTSAELVWVGQGCNSDTYVNNPSGKVALIVRGACTFNEKYQKAVAAGAVGVVIYNNVAGLFAGSGIAPKSVFGIGISNADGLALRNLTAPTLTWTNSIVSVANPTGNLISSFSSWGLSQDLELRPDVGAPGGLVRSAYPLEKGGYAILSGTSMSSPHVAGAVALLLEARPWLREDERVNMIKDLLQNTANPKAFSLAPTAGVAEASFREGSGMIDVVGAIQTKAVVEPSSISIAKTAGASTKTLTFYNWGNKPITYTPIHVPGVSASGRVYSPSFNTAFANVSFSASQVTVPSWGTARINVTISPNSALATKGLYGGYLVFQPSGGGVKLTVPYAGMQGGYQAIKILTLGSVLLDASGADYSAGGTFNLQGTNQPLILTHFEHGAQRYEVVILNASNNQPIHPVFNKMDEGAYTPRNSTANGAFAFVWDGTRITKYKRGDIYGTPVDVPAEFKPVPNGSYKLQLRVLKPTGNANNPSDWESWTSPVITLARP